MSDESIIIVTYPGSPLVQECLASLEGVDYPIHVCINPKRAGAYDTAAFYYAEEHGLETFMILHDTLMVKDKAFIEEAFSHEGLVSILGIPFLSCLGKYEKDLLPPLPMKPSNKQEAINFESHYARMLKPSHTLFPDLQDTNEYMEKHGKRRMLIENDSFRKYKSVWSEAMIEEGM